MCPNLLWITISKYLSRACSCGNDLSRSNNPSAKIPPFELVDPPDVAAAEEEVVAEFMAPHVVVPPSIDSGTDIGGDIFSEKGRTQPHPPSSNHNPGRRNGEEEKEEEKERRRNGKFGKLRDKVTWPKMTCSPSLTSFFFLLGFPEPKSREKKEEWGWGLVGRNGNWGLWQGQLFIDFERG